MFTNKTASYYSQDKVLIEAACLSTDTKPTTGVANGSKCIEMDTGKKYMFNEEDSKWEELPSSGGGGGGGGGGDFSTASVTISGVSANDPVFVPYIIDTEGMSLAQAFIPVDGTYSIVLYKGKGMLLDNYNRDGIITGAVEFIGGGAYFITGDGTITFSDK